MLGALAPTLRWTMDERSTGGGAVVALLVVTLVLIVCHAVALMMNWALFGRPYRPVEDQAEIFA
ncbi:MAG TPA: hypothetical protein VN157_05010 [Caulobacter sp.]|nr:hypothetical protein [Caulobacter sp.]